MTDKSMQQTREMLARHHRDGDAFAQLMKDTFDGRYDAEFWQAWQHSIEPVLPTAPVVLDLGTGPGMFLRAIADRYPQARAYGVECASYMLDAAIALPHNCEIIAADLHDPHLPLADNSVDAAVAMVVLHEMHQPVRTMLEVYRCLKPGGRLFVYDWVRAPLQQYLANRPLQVFARDTAVQDVDQLFVHFIEHNRFSTDDLEFMLQQTGFRVLEKTLQNNNQQARLIAEKQG